MSLGDRHRQERMWQRFQKVGIVVDDDQPQSNDGIQIFRDDALLSCRVIIHGLGWVYYVLSLRLISDSPNRVIEAFIIETDSEPIYVERGQKVPPRYVEWAPEADILNDRIGRGFGPTLCKKGLLLGQGAYSPVPNRKQRWTSITFE